MIYAHAPGSKYLIVLSHGRGGSLVSQDKDGIYTEQAKVRLLLGLGVDVLCYDYSGFGASTGERSEETFVQDCASAFQYAQGELKWPREKIVAVGQSLGTGVLIQHLAHNHGFAAVILIHPYRSIAACQSVVLARSVFRFIDLFKSEDVIHLVEGPVLVVHAESDQTVPYHNGAFLAKALARTGQLYKLATLRGIPPADAHARLFIVEPHAQEIANIVRTFLGSLTLGSQVPGFPEQECKLKDA
jgi:pimeloyl-ACP methyl ester carboxylesterase